MGQQMTMDARQARSRLKTETPAAAVFRLRCRPDLRDSTAVTRGVEYLTQYTPSFSYLDPLSNNYSTGVKLKIFYVLGLSGAPERIRTSDPQIRSLVLYRDADHRLRSGFSAKAPNRETSPPGEGRKALSPSRIDHPVTTETSSERFGHQNGRELATTGRYRTGRIGTRGRFSQYKSTLVGTEQNGSGRPPTNFECRASTAQRTFHGCKEVYWFGRLRASPCAAPNVGMNVGSEGQNANHIMISMGLGGRRLNRPVSL